MKYFSMMALATGVALAAATPANAALFIGVSVNGGAITQVATGSGSVNYNTTSGGYFYNVSATGAPLLASPQLLTQSVNIASQVSSNDVIDIYITQTDQTAFTGGLLSSFTSNTIQGLTAQLTSYYSTSNAVFSGTQLQTALFSDTGMFKGANALGTLNAPWSETVRYRLSFTGGNGSNFNGTANLTGVPEPTTWAMMMLGFGAMGALVRRRKTTTTARIRFA